MAELATNSSGNSDAPRSSLRCSVRKMKASLAVARLSVAPAISSRR
jgi:hypothetical protein